MKRILSIVSDAFGGHGGIAQYNRDLLQAICLHPHVREVVALPRIMPYPPGELPAKLKYIPPATPSFLDFFGRFFQILKENPRFDLILCGHIYLLFPCLVAKALLKKKIVLFVYGIDAWEPKYHRLTFLFPHVDRIISISQITLEKFHQWTSGYHWPKTDILPNAIHLDRYGAGPKSPELLKRYGLEGKTVLMTMGRLAFEERYKGFDEIIDLFPELLKQIPSAAYLIAGTGLDKARLEQKVRNMRLEKHVVFTGMVKESEKADHFRLADVYVMPSRGEGFGFVFLEAVACGIPTIGSITDGGREALLGGRLGMLVNPANPQEILEAIKRSLQKAKPFLPPELSYYSFENFVKRTHQLLEKML